MDVVENGPERPARRMPRIGLALLLAGGLVAVLVAERDEAGTAAQPRPVAIPATDPLADAAKGALPVQRGTRAVQAVPVRAEVVHTGQLRITPGSYQVDLACITNGQGSVVVRFESGVAAAGVTVACAAHAATTRVAIEVDPDGLSATLTPDTAEPLGVAWRITRTAA